MARGSTYSTMYAEQMTTTWRMLFCPKTFKQWLSQLVAEGLCEVGEKCWAASCRAQALTDRWRSSGTVILLGYVEDIRPYLSQAYFFCAVVVEEASHRLCWRRWTPGGVTRVDVALLKNWHEELFGLLVYFVSSVRLRQKWSCIQS